MNRNWTTSTYCQARAVCLRDGARLPVVLGVVDQSMKSNSAMTMTKDFIDHEPGGSDG